MNPRPFISVSCRFLRLAIVPIIALSLVAASITTVNADPQNSTTPRQNKVKYTKKYVRIVGSNIPVPVWVAEGPLPKTTYPVRSYDYNEISKIPGAYTPAQVLANDESITITGRH
jgi:hypothetical protein